MISKESKEGKLTYLSIDCLHKFKSIQISLNILLLKSLQILLKIYLIKIILELSIIISNLIILISHNNKKTQKDLTFFTNF